MKRCGFCGAHFTPPKWDRQPSSACDKCWLEIKAARQRREEEEKRAHADGLCNKVTCYWCILSRDITELAEHINNELDKER